MSNKKQNQNPPTKRDIEQFLKYIQDSWFLDLFKNSLADQILKGYQLKGNEELLAYEQNNKNLKIARQITEVMKDLERPIKEKRTQIWNLLKTKGYSNEIIKACDDLRTLIQETIESANKLSKEILSQNSLT